MEAILSTSQILNEVMESEDRAAWLFASAKKYSRLFERSMPLERFAGVHLQLLHQSVLHSSFLSKSLRSRYSLQADLERWQDRTLRDDRLLSNVPDLSGPELVQSLLSRGLYLHLPQMNQILQKNNSANSKVEEDWKRLLEQWIAIHRLLERSNALSTSFLLHLPPLLTSAFPNHRFALDD